MNGTLYDLDQQLQALLEAMTDPETGEFTGDFDQWSALNMARNAKLEASGHYYKEWTAQITAIKDEETRLKARRETLERKRVWMKENLARSLDGQNFETATVSMRFKKNAPSVEITDEAGLLQWAREYAPECLREKPPEPAKTEIKAKLQKGTHIPGAALVQTVRLEVK